MLRIFMLPAPAPGLVRLQADAATWQALIAQLPRDDRRTAVIVAAVERATGDRAQRVTMADDLARYVLRIAGVSS